MLERTAASIEPCSSSLQRVLPTARSCLRTRRKLQTAFWNHGASEFELLDACQALVRQSAAGSNAHATPAAPNRRPETMTASALLLDFLYPSGTAALLRRPYAIHPVRLDSGPRGRNHMSRLFTSGVPRPSDQPPRQQAAAEEPASIEDVEELDEAEEAEFGEEHDHESGFLRGDAKEETQELAVQGKEEDARYTDPRRFRKLLDSEHAGAYDQIFQQYTRLEPGLKDAFTTEVLLAISASARPIEAWRVNDMFSRYQVEDWTEDLVRAAVKAQLILHKVPEAMDIYETALRRRGFGRALDYISAYAFELSAWNLVIRAWELYSHFIGDATAGLTPPASGSSDTAVEPSRERDMGQGAEAGSRSVDLETGTAPLRDVEPTVESSILQESASISESTATSELETTADSANAPATGRGDELSVDQRLHTPALLDSTAHLEPRRAEDSSSIAQPEATQDAERVDGSAAVQNDSQILDSTVKQVPVDPLGFRSLAATSNFEAKAKELYKFLDNDPESLDQRTALVDSFFTHVVRHSLDLFQPSEVVFMLHRSKDPQSYERYIMLNVEQGRKRLAADLYKNCRALPNVHMAESVLRVMGDVFFPHNVVGMEQLLADWYKSYGRLSQSAYQRFMSFYGNRGDINSLMRLASEYAEHYGIKLEEDPEYLTTLMHAHAVRGDPEAANEVMVEAAEKSGTPPDIKQWNILLNAHTKARDYGAAIDLFSYICDELDPDNHTFTVMMGMAGFRGDLQFTLELLQLAKDRGVQTDVAMVRALVEAYCQNDRYGEAEQLCVNVTKKREMAGNYTVLWNSLLRHNAKRRDLTTVNRLLEYMSTHDIAYNQETYSHLLLALLYARQSHHAMHLLRVANREGVFEPTADHYVLLMAAFINSGEPHMAVKTNELMVQMKVPHSAKRMRQVIDSLGRWQQLPASKRRGRDGEYYLKRIMRDFHTALEREDEGSPDDQRSMTNLYSKVIFVLTQMREFATVQQIIRIHNSRYPKRAAPDTLPLKLLHQMMLADFHEKKYDRVKETWGLVLQRSHERYQPASSFLNPDGQTEPIPPDHPDHPDHHDHAPKPVIYSQRFRLCDPLKTMQRLYLELQDPDGLLRLVESVRKRGFDLDSKNWNFYVQALARLKKWRDAFTVCETVLMPQWTGWFRVRVEEQGRNRLPLDLRRMGRNPHRPRPISHTLLVLAKEYMDLEQMMLWSHEASREFEFINENCLKTVRAITSMHRSGSRLESQIFSGRGTGADRESAGDGEEQVEGEEEEEVVEVTGGEERMQGEEGEQGDEGEQGVDGEEMEEDTLGVRKVERTWKGGRKVRPYEKTKVFRKKRTYAADPGAYGEPGEAGEAGEPGQPGERREPAKSDWNPAGFSADGFLIGAAPSPGKKGVDLSEEDIINALKEGTAGDVEKTTRKGRRKDV